MPLRASHTSKKTFLPQSWQQVVTSSAFEKRLAFFLALAFCVSAVATYSALKQIPPLGNDPSTIIWLLNMDLVILLVFVALIARRVVGLWSGRKRGLAGSHLHVRLVYIFSLLAAVPAIVMTVFSVFFFYFGVQTWFSERVSTAIEESQAVAAAYLEEHKQVIRADTLAMATDLDREARFMLGGSLEDLERLVQAQSFVRNLSEAIVFDTSGRVLARSGLTFTLEYGEIPRYLVSQVQDGSVAVMTGDTEDRVRALVKLNNYNDAYLFVGRLIDPEVLSHLQSTQKASEDYQSLQARYSDLQITATAIFVLIGLILLLSAIWFGLVLARQLVEPITTMMTVADRVRGGDLAVRVPKQDHIQEFDYLANSLNRMTSQIEEQQGALIDANRQLDLRRKLTESVLTGVSAGVLGVKRDGEINLANSSAYDLLGLQSDDGPLIGQSVYRVMPDVGDLLEKSYERTGKTTQGEISAFHKDLSRRTFLVRIVVDDSRDDKGGAVLTFDDITDLQSAQRKAAWSDVARRIAHEIKNPLTPIQLSAERLKRKYLKQIEEDPETFERCTDTIVQHVGDIGRMIKEFSDFARMPEPVMLEHDAKPLIQEVLTLYEQAHREIVFELVVEEGCEESQSNFDAQLIRQALSNLIKNATDSIIESEPEKGGMLRVTLMRKDESSLAIVVSDNGKGFPQGEEIERLTEPYISKKPKGTGLGLAIVKKIMEDHEGSLVLGIPAWLSNNSNWISVGGATAILVLPIIGQLEETEKHLKSEAA